MGNVTIDRQTPRAGRAVNPVIDGLIQEFKQALQTRYGARLRTVVLYGSYARGDYDEESDIDLMLILNDEKVDTIAEVWGLTDLKMEFIHRFGKIVSVLPVPVSKYSSSFLPVYQNARQEGIIL